MSEDGYVTKDAWLNTGGRPDTIDDIADQFERPSGAGAYWSSLELRRGAAIRETAASFVPRLIERRAG
jgi:hypothetical protein